MKRLIKKADKVVMLNIPIDNVVFFIDKMKLLEYKNPMDNILSKVFDNIEIDIAYNNNVITSITGYKNNEIVAIPQEILDLVNKDINNCNK